MASSNARLATYNALYLYYLTSHKNTDMFKCRDNRTGFVWGKFDLAVYSALE